MSLANLQAFFSKMLKDPSRIFLVLSLAFGTMSTVLVPQLSVNDENMHYLRAYSLATGRLESVQCTYPKDVIDRAGGVYNGDYAADYSRPINTNDTKTDKCGSAVGYAPIMHLPQSLGIFIANLFNPPTGATILIGRLFNLAFYSAVLFLIIRKVRIGKWVFTTVGLLPLMIHTAASLSGDTTSNVAVLAAIAFSINLFTQKQPISNKQALILIALAGILGLTKLVNVLVLLPLALLPLILFKKNQGRFTAVPFNIHKWGFLAMAALFSIVCVIVWQKIFGSSLLSSGGVENPLASQPLDFIRILFNTYINPVIGYTDVVLKGTVGYFSSFKYGLPLFMLGLVLIVTLLALFKKEPGEEKALQQSVSKIAVANTLTVALFVAAVSYAMYTAWAIQPFRLGPGAPYADGVQGRYFTALIPLFIPVGIWAKKYIHIKPRSEIVFGVIMFSLYFVILAYYIFSTYWAFK